MTHSFFRTLAIPFLVLPLLVLSGCASSSVDVVFWIDEGEDSPENCFLRLREGWDTERVLDQKVTCPMSTSGDSYLCRVEKITCPKNSEALRDFIESRIGQYEREVDDAAETVSEYKHVLEMLPSDIAPPGFEGPDTTDYGTSPSDK